MNGVAMYLRGKLPPEEQDAIVQEEASAEETTETNDVERSAEYPPDDK